jgi:hypothetical protein
MTKYYKGCHFLFFYEYLIRKLLIFNIIGRILRKLKITKNAASVADFLNRLQCIRLIHCDVYTDYRDILLSSFERYRRVYVDGWFFFHELSKKYEAVFRIKYGLKERYYIGNKLYSKVMELKKDKKIIIGVHIRRGDYQQFNGGKYYYSDEIYRKFILNMKGITDKESVIIIFSNDIVRFDEDDKLIISKEEWYIDQHIMSICDYLIGTPSTFTRWASYMGQVKCYHIEEESKEIAMDAFRIYKG